MTNEIIKEAASLYNRREILLRNLYIVDKYFEDDNTVLTLGIGTYSIDEFIEIRQTKSVLRLVRNNLLIEINDINKQIDKI